MQQLKDGLTADMQEFLTESKWEQNVKEAVSELLQYKPEKPLVYLYEKHAIKSKLDQSNKIHAFINDVAFFASKMDPLILPANQILSKLLCIIVEKHQQSKIKSTIQKNYLVMLFDLKILTQITCIEKNKTEMDALKICLIILQDIPNAKEAKDYFFTKVMSMYEDILTIGKLSELILQCIFVFRSLLEFTLILDLLEMKGQSLSTQNFILFIQETPPSESINRFIDVLPSLEKYPQENKINPLSMMKFLIEFILAKKIE